MPPLHLRSVPFLGAVARRLLLLVLLGALVCVGLWAMRGPLLRATGRFLIVAGPELRSDAIYVLGGAPRERGEEGARLLRRGLAPMLHCTGSNIPAVLEEVGLPLTEAELSRDAALRIGADSARVHAMITGTSTWEEADAILAHARAMGHDTITVVSTEFHLRRVGWVFRKRSARTGITVLVRPAASLRYDPQRWWASEEGLIMVNNEYVKLAYYLLRY
ncbi:MAG: YdcF family protein [Flavobacteriales bacterium]|jgi:uncharacterized SAM-binding protein YcdF (DUF218 family)|nr:YdcF family protein [Flavobacteriales bacterium]